MIYQIKRAGTNLLAVEAQGSLTRRLMGEELVDMNFVLSSHVVFQLNDYVTINEENYYLIDAPTVEQISSKEWTYNLIFKSIKYRLKDVSLLFYDEENQLTMPSFDLMTDASRIVELIVENANRVQSGWTIGIVDETETKLLNFEDISCLEALSKVAEEFELEFWVDADKSIHFTERNPDANLTLEYGYQKGLQKLTRTPLSESSIVTRLYVKGSDKNLPMNYRNGQKYLRMAVPYLENNTTKYGVIEHTETFNDIYPKRIGVVTSVNASNPLVFSDNTLDFDLNAHDGQTTTILIPNVSAKVVFQTGQLAGYRFEIHERGYEHSTKTFTMLPNQEEKAWEVPSETIRPAIGDTYILEDIQMPTSYVANAETLLQVKGQEYIDRNSDIRYTYQAISDPFMFRSLNIHLKVGSMVQLKSNEFDLNQSIRVMAVVQDLQNPFDQQPEFSDVTYPSAIVSQFYKQEKERNQIFREQRYNAASSRRAFMFAQEHADKVFDGEGYFDMDNFKAASIDTKLLNIGSRMQQFGLPGVKFEFNNSYNRLNWSAGTLVHSTIADEPVTWYIASGNQSGLNHEYHYIYCKASKLNNNATFILTTSPLKVDKDSNYYHFEVGYISSLVDGLRIIKTTYGFAQINPSELSIGKISSPSGSDFIEFKEDKIEINGKISFTADSPAKIEISTEINQSEQNAIDASNAYADAQAEFERVQAEAYADGIVTAEEQRAIADAQAKLNEAKQYAEQQDAILEGVLENYTDSEVLQAQQNAINASNAYADAQDVYNKTLTEAYADGIVTSEEQRAIADAQAKLNEAKQYAEQQDAILEGVLESYTDDEIGKIEIGGRNLLKDSNFISSDSEADAWRRAHSTTLEMFDGQARYTSVTTSSSSRLERNIYLDKGQYTLSLKVKSNAEAPLLRLSNLVNAESESTSYKSINGEYKVLSFSFEVLEDGNTTLRLYFSTSLLTGDFLLVDWFMLTRGNVSIADWSPAREDIEQDIQQARQNAINASNAYADAQDVYNKTLTEAYADGIVTSEEQRAIADAQAKLNEAKQYAEQQDAILEGVLESYTDDEIGKIEIGGANLIRWSNFNVPYSSYLGWSSIAGQHTVEGAIYKKTITTTNTSARAEWGNNNLNNYIDRNGTYTVSLWYKATKSLTLRVLVGADVLSTVKPMSATGLSGSFQEAVFVIEVTDFENLILRWYFIGNSQGEEVWIDKWQLEKGNKPSDWSLSTFEIEAEIQQARQNALDAQATANAVKEVTDWMNPTIVGGGGVVASGTMLVGNNAQGARAGISGLGTTGNFPRFWAGADFTGRATAPFVVEEDGTWKQHDAQGNLVRRTGILGGEYVDELYNTAAGNKTIAKRTAIVNGNIVEQWYKNGILMYEIGMNGIYYVSETPESWTKQELMNGGTLMDGMLFNSKLCALAGGGYKWNVPVDRTAYAYDSGRNVNSESNKQYHGYKTTNGSRTSNIPNGWWILRSAMVPMYPNGDPMFSAIRTEGGKVVESQTLVGSASSILPCS